MQSDPSRCPSCAAAAPPGAPWCTQCYAALGRPVRATVAPGQAEIPAPRRPEPPVPSAGSWPCTGCTAANPLDQDRCTACDTPFLADLSGADLPVLVLPVVGDVARLSRVQRLVVGLGVCSAAVAGTGVLGLLLR